MRSVRIRGGIALLAGALVACADGGAQRTGSRGGDTMAQAPSITEVQQARSSAWMEVPGVVGTGVGRCGGEPCIKVFVSHRTPEVEARIPGSVEGHPVRVEVTGSFRARRDTGEG